MMIKPSINVLLDKKDEITHEKVFDSRYTLVILTAKRARELNDGAEKLTRFNSNKAVSIAIQEIDDDKISFKRNAQPKTPTAPPTYTEQSLDAKTSD